MASVYETHIFHLECQRFSNLTTGRKEFMNSVIEKLLHSWSTDIQMIQAKDSVLSLYHLYIGTHGILKVRG